MTFKSTDDNLGISEGDVKIEISDEKDGKEKDLGCCAS